jgi:hypothetical protein
MATKKKDESDALSSSKGGKKRRDMKMEFIITPEPQLPEKKISESQQIQLDIIAKTNFNFFNGRRIAEWLRENHKM